MIELSASSTMTTLTVTGDLDLAERTTFTQIAARAEALGGEVLAVDLCAAAYLDSTGAAFLVAMARTARERGARALLRGGSDQAVFVLEGCGARDVLEVDEEHEDCAPVLARRPWARPAG